MHEHDQMIGETAGKIHKALEKSGGTSLDTLPKEIGINDTALFNQAIGWLCREGKLDFEKKGQSLKASLIVSHDNCCQ